MNATMAMQEMDGFWHEARRYCDERDLPPDSVEKVAHALRSEAFRTAIQPFLKIKSDLMLCKVPKMTLYPDGRFESVYEWTDEEKKAFAQMDELVADVAKRYGLAPQEPSCPCWNPPITVHPGCKIHVGAGPQEPAE